VRQKHCEDRKRDGGVTVPFELGTFWSTEAFSIHSELITSMASAFKNADRWIIGIESSGKLKINFGIRISRRKTS
jgi:hypothetical protein